MGRKARNTGHKALRARAIVGLADYVGWEQRAWRILHGRAGHGGGAAVLLAYDAVCVLLAAAFPDGGKGLREANTTPLTPAGGGSVHRYADDRRRSRTVFGISSPRI